MFKKLCIWAYRVSLLVLVGHTAYGGVVNGWNAAFHDSAYYIPIVAMFLTFSAQADLLEKIYQGEVVNIKSRAIDFFHWLLLTFMFVGRWEMGGMTIWAFLLNIVLLSIIGWQIGVGIGRQWFPTKKEKHLGMALVVIAACLGLAVGKIRTLDSELFGWGWALEVVTAIMATLMVVWWIVGDMSVITHKASGYPRSFFLKGMCNGALAILLLYHLITSYHGGGTYEAWKVNAGIAFNVIVGNGVFWVYYLAWEYCRRQQLKSANFNA